MNTLELDTPIVGENFAPYKSTPEDDGDTHHFSILKDQEKIEKPDKIRDILSTLEVLGKKYPNRLAKIKALIFDIEDENNLTIIQDKISRSGVLSPEEKLEILEETDKNDQETEGVSTEFLKLASEKLVSTREKYLSYFTKNKTDFDDRKVRYANSLIGLGAEHKQLPVQNVEDDLVVSEGDYHTALQAARRQSTDSLVGASEFIENERSLFYRKSNEFFNKTEKSIIGKARLVWKNRAPSARDLLSMALVGAVSFVAGPEAVLIGRSALSKVDGIIRKKLNEDRLFVQEGVARHDFKDEPEKQKLFNKGLSILDKVRTPELTDEEQFALTPDAKKARIEFNLALERKLIESGQDVGARIEYKGGRIMVFKEGNNIEIKLNGKKIGGGKLSSQGAELVYNKSLDATPEADEWQRAFEKAVEVISTEKKNSFIYDPSI